MGNFNDFVSLTEQTVGWDTPGSNEMADGDKRKRVAGPNLVEFEVVSFVPSSEAGNVCLKHKARGVENIRQKQLFYDQS